MYLDDPKIQFSSFFFQIPFKISRQNALRRRAQFYRFIELLLLLFCHVNNKKKTLEFHRTIGIPNAREAR